MTQNVLPWRSDVFSGQPEGEQPDPDEILTPSEVAEMLKLFRKNGKPNTPFVLLLRRRGELPGSCVARQIRFLRADVMAYLHRNKGNGETLSGA